MKREVFLELNVCLPLPDDASKHSSLDFIAVQEHISLPRHHRHEPVIITTSSIPPNPSLKVTPRLTFSDTPHPSPS